MLKKIFKVIGLIVFFLVVMFGSIIFFEVKDELKEMKKLEKEVEEISNIANATEFDEESYKKHLNKTVTTGEVFKVERAYKNWLRDYLKTINEIEEFYTVLGKGELISEETIIADGKSFTTLRSTLNAYSNKLDDLRNKFNNLSDEDYVLKYYDKKGNASYTDYFLEIIGDIRQTQEEKEISNNLKNSSKYLKDVKAIYDFLSNNQNHWIIKNNTLLFDSEALLNEYKNLINNIIDIDTRTTETNPDSI